MFIKNIDAECECGFLPANHVHCAYMEYRKLSPLEQLKILYSKWCIMSQTSKSMLYFLIFLLFVDTAINLIMLV